MQIEGYDGWAGEFPFEVGDVCLDSDEEDVCILLYANYAYVYFWYLLSGHPEPLCARIERVIDDYTKIGHVDEAVVEKLLALYTKKAQDWIDFLNFKQEKKGKH